VAAVQVGLQQHRSCLEATDRQGTAKLGAVDAVDGARARPDRRGSVGAEDAKPGGSSPALAAPSTGVNVSEMSDRLRIVPEFRPDEYERARELLFGRLERRLSRWQPEQVELELSVKERDTSSQRTVLECWIAGLPKIVGTSTEQEIEKAIVEVRDDVWRQIDRHVTKKESARSR
jgi:hypothetical protein